MTSIQPISTTSPEIKTAMPSKQHRNSVVRQQKRPAQRPSEPKRETTKDRADYRVVEEHIHEVQTCYRIGVAIHSACSFHAARFAMEEQARLHELPQNTARRYRQFAQNYTQSQLDALYREFRAQNFALSVTHFCVLAGVKDKKLRKAMTQVAIQQRLSVSGLRKLKKAKVKEPGTAGGRRPDVVKMRSKRELHAAIKFELARWDRWLAMLLSQERNINHALKSTLSDIQALVEKAQELSRS